MGEMCSSALAVTPPPPHAGYLDISVEDAGPHQVQDSAHAHAQTQHSFSSFPNLIMLNVHLYWQICDLLRLLTRHASPSNHLK